MEGGWGEGWTPMDMKPEDLVSYMDKHNNLMK